MNDKKTKRKKTVNKSLDEITKVPKFKNFLEGRFREFLEKYFLVDFISVNFHYDLTNKARCDDGELIFDINYVSHYRQCHINVYSGAYQMWLKGQLKELENGAIHELSHMHTQKISDVAEDRYATKKNFREVNEELTEVIAEYVRRIRALTEDNDNLKGRKNKNNEASITKKRRSLDNTK